MDFYYLDISPPCRSVMLTAKALGIDLNKKVVNLLAGEHMKPEFLAINFQHTIPALVDGDFNLWESCAISSYLVNKYGKDDSLYPKDPKTRAMVDRLLFFDEGTLFNRFKQYWHPVTFLGEAPNADKLEPIHEALEFLEKFLDGPNFAVGSNITIADHALVTTYSSMVAFGGIDTSKYTNINGWFERCKTQMPGYESENGAGAKGFGDFIKSKFAVHK